MCVCVCVCMCVHVCVCVCVCVCVMCVCMCVCVLCVHVCVCVCVMCVCACVCVMCVCVCACVCVLCVNHLFQRPTVMNINVSLWSGMERVRVHACLLQAPLKKTLNGFVLFFAGVYDSVGVANKGLVYILLARQPATSEELSFEEGKLLKVLERGGGSRGMH